MTNYTNRPVAFIITSTDHGTMIINRNDYKMIDPKNGYGVGYQILNNSAYDADQIGFCNELIKQRRKYFGDGTVILDCGANIGVFTIEWAKLTTGWGKVVAYEIQERVFYALAGNIALNNCFNAQAKFFALGENSGYLDIPVLDHTVPTSFGSFEAIKLSRSENIGQNIDYTKTVKVPKISLDSEKFDRVDFLKIDVEGAEMNVLNGAKATIKACKPLIFIEVLKSDSQKIDSFLKSLDYICHVIGKDMIAVHKTDPIAKNFTIKDGMLGLASV